MDRETDRGGRRKKMSQEKNQILIEDRHRYRQFEAVPFVDSENE
jgi:hypothetical protein